MRTAGTSKATSLAPTPDGAGEGWVGDCLMVAMGTMDVTRKAKTFTTLQTTIETADNERSHPQGKNVEKRWLESTPYPMDQNMPPSVVANASLCGGCHCVASAGRQVDGYKSEATDAAAGDVRTIRLDDDTTRRQLLLVLRHIGGNTRLENAARQQGGAAQGDAPRPMFQTRSKLPPSLVSSTRTSHPSEHRPAHHAGSNRIECQNLGHHERMNAPHRSGPQEYLLNLLAEPRLTG
jgi:hypothetical protein